MFKQKALKKKEQRTGSLPKVIILKNKNTFKKQKER